MALLNDTISLIKDLRNKSQNNNGTVLKKAANNNGSVVNNVVNKVGSLTM
jgi:hypothetical protein